jgi:hypothetical protein
MQCRSHALVVMVSNQPEVESRQRDAVDNKVPLRRHKAIAAEKCFLES